MADVLVGPIKGLKKGKGRGMEWTMAVDLPALEGTLDAKKLGGVFATELVDRYRENLRRGKQADGHEPPHQFNKRMEEGRAIKRSLIEGAPIGGRASEVTKWIADALNVAPRKRSQAHRDWIAYRKALIKHYTLLKKFGPINGIKQPSQRRLYLPDPNNGTPINNSGMMADALSARYIPQRKGTNRNTGQIYDIRAGITVGTCASRAHALSVHGGFIRGINPVSFIQANAASFTNTTNLWNNAVRWHDMKSNAMAFMAAWRVMMMVMQRVGPLS